MTFASATFAGTAFQELSAADANWSKQSGNAQDLILGSTGAYLISNSNTLAGVYQHSGSPASADYGVFADIQKLSGSTSGLQLGVAGRCAAAANTFYFVIYTHSSTNLRLFKRVAGTQTQLGSSYTMTLSAAQRIELRMVGDQISAYVDGVLRIGPVTDSAITAAGKAGVYAFHARETSVADSGSIDNFEAIDIGGDTTAPVLTSPTGTATGATTATVGATTDEANGTMYAFVSTSATPPSEADLIAGTGAVWAGSQAISTTGAKTLSATGLTASTGYYAHLLHRDAASNDSNTVTSAQFTTAAGASPPGTPGTPTFSATTKNSTTVSWTAASGDVDGYEYRLDGGSWVDVGDVLTEDLTGLTPGDTVTVEVRAYGPGGDGTASTADVTLLLWGFAFSTATGLDFGAIVGALTGVAREAEDASYTVFVHDDADRELLLTSGALTIDADGRLPDYTNAALDPGTYFVSFRRSDGEFAAARINTVDLS